jgi:hypothetical protein
MVARLTNDFLKRLQICLSVGGVLVQPCVSAHWLIMSGTTLGQPTADKNAVILGDTAGLGID